MLYYIILYYIIPGLILHFTRTSSYTRHTGAASRSRMPRGRTSPGVYSYYSIVYIVLYCVLYYVQIVYIVSIVLHYVLYYSIVSHTRLWYVRIYYDILHRTIIYYTGL